MTVNISYTTNSSPDTWFHIHKCFTPSIADKLLTFFPDHEEKPITGKREGANKFRQFVSKQRTPELAKIFADFETQALRHHFSDITGVDCTQGHLRIELCQDGPGFYLDTHVDIPEKLITLQIYLGTGKEDWGTTLYYPQGAVHRTVPFLHNSGWMGHKDAPLLHGVIKEKVDGLRKSVIINYVVGNWRDTEQLYDYASSEGDDLS